MTREAKMTREELQAMLATCEAGQDPFESGEVDVHAVLSLALRGLDVTPRPIEDAPRDGTRFLSFGNSKDYPGTRYVWPCSWTDLGWTTVTHFLENEPDSFLPYSAIPQATP